MNRIRIVCREPEQPKLSVDGRITTWLLASFGDCEVTAIDDDGREVPIRSFTGVRWEAKQGEPTRAWIEVSGAEIDAVGLPELDVARENKVAAERLRRLASHLARRECAPSLEGYGDVDGLERAARILETGEWPDVPARAHCGRDPSAIGVCGGTDDTCSCECNTCMPPV